MPSLALFDSKGKPIAFAAECFTPTMKRRTQKERLYLAKHWKLHLHPLSMRFDPEATLVTPVDEIKLDRKSERGDLDENGSTERERETDQQ